MYRALFTTFCSGRYDLSVYGIHFELRFFDSIYKVGPSGIRTHDLVLTVHTLLTTELPGRTIRCA